MIRKEILMVGVLGAVVATVSMGGYGCARSSTETRAEVESAEAANDINAVSVQVERPQRQDLSRQVVLPGSIEAFEQVTLYAKAAGYLKWIKVDIGDRVRKGEVLAQIDVPEMADQYKEAEAEVARAMASLTNAQAELERARAETALKKITYQRLASVREEEPDVLSQQKVDEAKAEYQVARAMVNVAQSQVAVAESDVARAEAARGRLATLMEYAKIRAPFNGVVTKRYVDPGALIQQALSQTNVSPVVTVARVDKLRVFISVAEPEVPFIKKGNPARLTLDALPGRVFAGTCTRFATALDPKTRTMRAEIDIPNRDGQLRPGMYGNVTLMLGQRHNVLTVPAGALIAEAGKTYVNTVVGGKARRQEVETGFDDGIRVEITKGLSGNESVIVASPSGVTDGTPVRVIGQ